jgi:hypothetical protein
LVEGMTFWWRQMTSGDLASLGLAWGLNPMWALPVCLRSTACFSVLWMVHLSTRVGLASMPCQHTDLQLLPRAISPGREFIRSHSGIYYHIYHGVESTKWTCTLVS